MAKPAEEPTSSETPTNSSHDSGSSNIKVSPSDVVAAGCAAIAAGALFGGASAYRSGSKSLMEDGINPSNRMRMIPVAVKTLLLSTVFTGVLGSMGFVALKSAGVFSTDVAELPSAKEAVRLLREPRAYLRELVQAEERKASSSDRQP
ncbi:hypothetical protein DUNSADRAFT_11585 [Dunaliella salina]|uniref:Transmembrane protein 242 n=1 Tax=Dunaliella salina TaxID=3046 RepID=A0ABQ7GDB3_DUNSA|nr:hypothetical protein DUNSADRAFT_11585 [Dunaliella salina]|eukprot:KAF5832513.1 hypothetical protein DUNSADRAFT_11585 [Dunaliella salina]